jgi:tripartite-type tricarboxylate transporter receptor subunit TctC
MTLTRRLALAGAAAFAAPTTLRAQAEPFPTRPLRMLVPFAPGGPLDLNGRPLADRLGAQLGQTVVFENRPGANGIVATQIVANSKPDGYTLLYTTGSFVGNIVFAQQPLPYDPMKDVAPVTLIADGSGMMLVGRAGLPANTMAELVALARSKPGGLSCGITGFGNITHLGAEQFRQFTGAELLNVVLHGTGPAINEMLAGNIDLNFSTIAPVAPLLREGKLKAFGYTSRRRALYWAPDIPTMQEQGYPEWELMGMSGLWTTGGTPRDRILRVQQAVHAVVRQPAFVQLLRESELEGSGMPPEEFAEYLQKELAMQRGIARSIGIGRT